MDHIPIEGDNGISRSKPVLKWIIWGLGIVTLTMVVISFIGCLVRGHINKTYYLLACNLIISGLIGLVNAWWFKNGHLESDKHWYIIILSAVILWQTISTDVYIFSPTPGFSNLTTVAPHSTTATP